QPVLGPDAVAFVALDEDVAVRAGQTVGIEEGEEVAFQVALGAAGRETRVVEDAVDRGGPSAAGVVRDERIERDQVGAVLVLGLVEGALDVVTREDGGEVEEGAGDGGDWDTGARGDLVVTRAGSATATSRRGVTSGAMSAPNDASLAMPPAWQAERRVGRGVCA